MEFGNQLAWLQAQERVVEQERELEGLFQHRAQALWAEQALRAQREQAVAEFEKSVLNELAEAQQKAGEFTSERDKAERRLTLQTIRSPIDGTIQQLATHTIGGVVTPAEPLMTIVPDDEGLVVEARVPNKDVGFVRAGQEAQVKVETFNFTRYGLIAGRVLDVSRDAVRESSSAANHQNHSARPDGDAERNSESADYVAHIALDASSIMTEGGLVALGPG